jgi:hypothetical protein
LLDAISFLSEAGEAGGALASYDDAPCLQFRPKPGSIAHPQPA